jgi:hypothetical protein
MQLDEANEQLFMSLDVMPLLCEIPNAASHLFSAIIPQNNRSNQQQTPRRYNLRRNSDFPCPSTHASRSSEFLQVPMSTSQQRLRNQSQQLLSKLPRVRDIREASMDQIIFRVIDPFASLSSTSKQQQQHPTEPIINISSFDDVMSSSVVRPNSLDIKESPIASTTASNAPLLRELKPYARSKTTPLSSSSGAQQFLAPKHCEARDLCGSSSTDDSASPATGHHSTLV